MRASQWFRFRDGHVRAYMMRACLDSCSISGRVNLSSMHRLLTASMVRPLSFGCLCFSSMAGLSSRRQPHSGTLRRAVSLVGRCMLPGSLRLQAKWQAAPSSSAAPVVDRPPPGPAYVRTSSHLPEICLSDSCYQDSRLLPFRHRIDEGFRHHKKDCLNSSFVRHSWYNAYNFRCK